MVARYKAGTNGAHAGSFKSEDKRRKNGRKKGSKNILPRTYKEAISEAMTLYGFDGKGKLGLVGYFLRIVADPVLGCRLAEKILPMQVTGVNDGPVQFSIPPETIKILTTAELQVLEIVLKKMAGLGQQQQPLMIEHQPTGDASKYAKEIGITSTRH
jgi:hypothetical protein